MAFKVSGVTDPAKVAGVAEPAKVAGVTSAYGGGAPVQVTSSNNFAPFYGSRLIVRTAAGIPYIVGMHTGSISIYKGDGTTPTSFAEQDSDHKPTAATLGVASAIDSNGIIGAVYFSNSTTLSFVTFNTSTDLWGTPETIATVTDATANNWGKGICYDSANKPHVFYCVDYAGYYSNKVSGSWCTPVNVDGTKGAKYGDITMDSDGLPIIVYASDNLSRVVAAKGTDPASPPVTFTLQTIETDGDNLYYGQAQICVDSSGDHHVAYTTYNIQSYAIRIRKHIKADTWATWQTIEQIDSNLEYRYLGLAVNGTTRYIVARHDSATAGICAYPTASWSATPVNTGTYFFPSVRWSYLNNPSYATYGIDYIYIDGLTSDRNLWWSRIII